MIRKNDRPYLAGSEVGLRAHTRQDHQFVAAEKPMQLYYCPSCGNPIQEGEKKH